MLAAQTAAPVLSTAAAPGSEFAEPVAELVVSPDGRILECGTAAARMLGLSDPAEAMGVHLSLFCRDADRLAEALGAAAVTGRLERWDADLVRLDGKALPAVVDLVATFDAPRTLTSLRVAIKPVTAWPTPAPGPVAVPAKRDEASQLSHELNNLLAIISGHAECLLSPGANAADAGAVEAIRRAVASAAQVSARVRGLSQRREQAARAVDIDALLAAVQDDVRRTFGHRLAVAVQPAPHPWTVSIDRAVVHHALAALAAEAIEAMPHGGTLTFRTMNVEVGARRPHAPVGARPGRYVRVEVSYLTADMPAPPNQQRRDTDEAGVAAIEALRRAGGRVMVDTDGHRVASVVLLLPSDGVTVLRPRNTDAPRQSGQTVVLVEGDPTHRRLLQAVLRGQGHDVETVQTAEEADRLTAMQPGLVLVTDRLPGASTAESAAWVAARPTLRLLGTSDDVARALALVPDPRQALSISRPLAAGQITDAVKALFQGEVTLDAPDAGADVLAPLWFKRDGAEPIHPLEAS